MTSVEQLLRAAESLHARLPNAAPRLEATVLRPLRAALGDAARTEQTIALPDDPVAAVRELAIAASALVPTSADLFEATAGLQRLACDLAPSEDDASALRSELPGAEPGIRVKKDGPYLVSSLKLRNHLGEDVPTAPITALCRCGASATKPFCDGSHASNGFKGDKDPTRVADHRDRYQGVTLTVLDNRGTCAHAGFCSDRLNSVFHVGQEPFVTASGGRLDEVVRAVRACPSGALSFAIDDKEQRSATDSARKPIIEISKDGPYRMTGSIPLHGDDGAVEPRNEGASFEHYSLCRCGRSQNKPFCSGMHGSVSFRDPQPPAEPSLFEWAGGYPALLRMTQIFYSKYVPQDALLSPLFGHMSPDHPERVAAWLSEVFGGPKLYTDHYGGYQRMISQHLGKSLREKQRARWAQLMYQSADDAGVPNDAEFRAAFAGYVEWGSRIALENSQPGAKPPPKMPVPHWWWVCNATPQSRMSALSPPEAKTEAPPLPADGETPSFETHVKGLFRPMDRESMKFAFDLWAHADVAEHAAAILQRLEAGTMPCDGAWAKEKLTVFKQWVDAGTPE